MNCIWVLEACRPPDCGSENGDTRASPSGRPQLALSGFVRSLYCSGPFCQSEMLSTAKLTYKDGIGLGKSLPGHDLVWLLKGFSKHF